MTLYKSSLFALFILALGAAATSAQADGMRPEQTVYLLGEVKMSSPAGQPYGSTLSLVKRTMTPSQNKIVELVATISAREPSKEFTTIIEVKGSKFTVRDTDGSFSGSGELIGKAWEWTGWKYTVDMTGERKGTMKAEDTMTPTGLTASKTYAGPDGKPRVIFAEDLRPISREAYEILHAKLLPK